jgi:hypothetical protein
VTSIPALGIRLNNPLNIRQGQTWRGLAPVQIHPEFCEFVEPIYGIRAGARILGTYAQKYGVRTINEAITRWAPPEENDTAAYVSEVCLECTRGPNVPFNFANPFELTMMIRAMMRQEIGSIPYLLVVIADGVKLALMEDADA